MSSSTLENLVMEENVSVLYPLLPELPETSIASIVKMAIQYKKIGILSSIHCCGHISDPLLDHFDVTNSEIDNEVLKWFVKNYPHCQLGKIYKYIEKQKRTDIDLIRTARKSGFEPSAYLCVLAAKTNHITEIEPWLNENGHKCDVCICAIIAFKGDLELLKWLREQNCPWDSKTCEMAVEGEHLEILQWARENECPWDDITYRIAKKRGNQKILDWLEKNNCPLNNSKSFCSLY